MPSSLPVRQECLLHRDSKPRWPATRATHVCVKAAKWWRSTWIRIPVGSPKSQSFHAEAQGQVQSHGGRCRWFRWFLFHASQGVVIDPVYDLTQRLVVFFEPE